MGGSVKIGPAVGGTAPEPATDGKEIDDADR
jgi:hypothetical protein